MLLLHQPSATEIYTLSLHDALPISLRCAGREPAHQGPHPGAPLTIANRFVKRSVVAGAGAMLAALPARADWSLINMPEGVSVLSREIHGMHMIRFWICMAMAVVTLCQMILAMVL